MTKHREALSLTVIVDTMLPVFQARSDLFEAYTSCTVQEHL